MRGWIVLLSLLTLLALAPALMNGATVEKFRYYTLGAVFGVLTIVCLAAWAGRGTE